MSKIKNILGKQLPFFLSLPALLWPIIMVGFPLITLLSVSLYDHDTHTLTFTYYRYFFNNIYAHVFLQSFFFALSATVGTLLIGYPVAYFITFYTKRCKLFLLFLLTLPFWSNFIIQVYAWFFILEKEGLLNTLLVYLRLIDTPLTLMYTMGAIVFIMIYCYLPFMVIPIVNSLEKIEGKLHEASMDLGATRWQTFRYITFPLSLKGVQTGIVLVFVPSFGEFVIPSLIGGSKYLSVGSLISYYYIEIYNQTMGATFTIMGCLILLITISCFYYIVHLLNRSCKVKGDNA